MALADVALFHISCIVFVSWFLKLILKFEALRHILRKGPPAVRDGQGSQRYFNS